MSQNRTPKGFETFFLQVGVGVEQFWKENFEFLNLLFLNHPYGLQQVLGNLLRGLQ